MIEALEIRVRELEAVGFCDLVLSVKASDPALCIAVNRLLVQHFDYPLHLGVTEAGTRQKGALRSAVALGSLLSEGIGDTIRVSLTTDPLEEVRVAYEILEALGLARKGARLISCPTCGRTAVDLCKLAEAVETRLASITAPIDVAVMGCVVNGPGEARLADCGLAGGKGQYALFAGGEIIRKVSEEEAIDALMDLIAERWPEKSSN